MSGSFLVVGFGLVDSGVDTSAEALQLCEVVGHSPRVLFDKIEDIVSVDHKVQVKQIRVVQYLREHVFPDRIGVCRPVDDNVSAHSGQCDTVAERHALTRYLNRVQRLKQIFRLDLKEEFG